MKAYSCFEAGKWLAPCQGHYVDSEIGRDHMRDYPQSGSVCLGSGERPAPLLRASR